MKSKVIFEDLDESELKAINNAVQNQLILDSLYDSALRGVIKYSEDENKAEAYSSVWEEIKDQVHPTRYQGPDSLLLALVLTLMGSVFIGHAALLPSDIVGVFIKSLFKLISIVVSVMIILGFKRK